MYPRIAYKGAMLVHPFSKQKADDKSKDKEERLF